MENTTQTKKRSAMFGTLLGTLIEYRPGKEGKSDLIVLVGGADLKAYIFCSPKLTGVEAFVNERVAVRVTMTYKPITAYQKYEVITDQDRDAKPMIEFRQETVGFRNNFTAYAITKLEDKE